MNIIKLNKYFSTVSVSDSLPIELLIQISSNTNYYKQLCENNNIEIFDVFTEGVTRDEKILGILSSAEQYYMTTMKSEIVDNNFTFLSILIKNHLNKLKQNTKLLTPLLIHINELDNKLFVTIQSRGWLPIKMNNRRKIIYELELFMSDGSTPKIQVATFDKMNIEQLIESNRIFLELPKVVLDGRRTQPSKLNSFKIIGETFTFNMTLQEYEDAISICDIVEDDENKSNMNFFKVTV